MAHSGGNRCLMLCKNSPESIRSPPGKTQLELRVLVFSGQTSLQGWFGGGAQHSQCRCARVASRSTQECRTERRPWRWRRRRPWRPIYSASTGGARYDLSLPPLSSLSQLANGEKNADNLLFFSHQVALKLELHPDEVTTVPPPEPLFVSHSNKPKPRCKAD